MDVSYAEILPSHLLKTTPAAALIHHHLVRLSVLDNVEAQPASTATFIYPSFIPLHFLSTTSELVQETTTTTGTMISELNPLLRRAADMAMDAASKTTEQPVPDNSPEQRSFYNWAWVVGLINLCIFIPIFILVRSPSQCCQVP